MASPFPTPLPATTPTLFLSTGAFRNCFRLSLDGFGRLSIHCGTGHPDVLTTLAILKNAGDVNDMRAEVV